MPHYFCSNQNSKQAISSLKNSFEFNVLFKDGVRLNHDNICIHAISLNKLKYKLQHSRKYNRDLCGNVLLGFSINKKVAKSVKRNLIRRRIKAIFLYLSREMSIRNTAFALVCRKGILEWDFHSLKQHIIRSIHKIKKLLTNPNKRHMSTYAYRQDTNKQDSK
ncbi:ribonuclease P protein component [Helicobacter muridarum]|uniref:Ribonuclease P protein component n=1 Tax=Helicobacter muridarum TaxID=216 RepID=A0A377PRN6_9HELI|nr:ribonuclease P protein component [Helicobacter muridarum]TLE00630.1 ribonuclease P protein component [Helicobacter muridarum]STQ85648.1 ribonuclease P protein [Helicobacter muridarum]